MTGTQSFVIGTSGLLVVLVVSLILAFSRAVPTGSDVSPFRTILVATVCCQLIHLSEETIFGFYQQFPELLGLTPWEVSLFLGFNLTWVGIWLTAVFLVPRHRLSLAAFWFLAIASVANAVAHPAFSMLVNGYFPGLISSPLVGILGLFLVRRLYQVTNTKRSGNAA